MNSFQRFLISRNFTFLSVFMIFFCVVSLLLLNIYHPLYMFSILCGVVVFILQRYRKSLLKRP